MSRVGVELDDVAGASMLEEIRRNAEHRLREIEPLIEEAERLRDVLSLITRQSPPRRRERGPARNVVSHAHRAAKGANKRMILDLIAQRPGITPAEISQITGVKRTVVASTVSRLKRFGELEAHEGGGVRLAHERTPA